MKLIYSTLHILLPGNTDTQSVASTCLCTYFVLKGCVKARSRCVFGLTSLKLVLRYVKFFSKRAFLHLALVAIITIQRHL